MADMDFPSQGHNDVKVGVSPTPPALSYQVY